MINLNGWGPSPDDGNPLPLGSEVGWPGGCVKGLAWIRDKYVNEPKPITEVGTCAFFCIIVLTAPSQKCVTLKLFGHMALWAGSQRPLAETFRVFFPANVPDIFGAKYCSVCAEIFWWTVFHENEKWKCVTGRIRAFDLQHWNTPHFSLHPCYTWKKNST